MVSRYMVKVYDCSFVQDFVLCYEKLFDSFDEARAYAETLMKDFANRGLYEYTVELYIRSLTIGAFEPMGYFEFDYMGSDDDLFDLVATMGDINELGMFSYHDMF